MKKLKTKLSTAMLLLALVLGVQRMSSCNKPCTVEKNCGFTSTTINAFDTIYYPYVSDFANEGKIYTYEITVDGKTFIRSYKMSTFEHHYETEFNYYNRDDCSIALPCDSTINRWYEMKCEEVDGQGYLVFKTRGESTMTLQFYDVREFYRNDWNGYSLKKNLERWDKIENDIQVTIQWIEDFYFNDNKFKEVTTVNRINQEGDTIWHYAFNRKNGIILSLNNENNQRNEIKLLEIL